jgi:hypothetical protein
VSIEMRFVSDGPDIPNGVIKQWRNGNVLFIAGAGVSVPSSLPLFDGLALAVYEYLRDQLFEIIKEAQRARSIKGRTGILEQAALSPDRRVEAELFFEKQFDRFFSALEKRVDPDMRGQLRTRRVREAVEAILGGRQPSQSHQDLLRLSYAPSPAGPPQPPACRIATTNFDLLFEAAWPLEFGGPPRSYDARMAPRAGSHSFSGIIHLHGMLGSDSQQTAEYILSSRDFARVYLRSGVIGNYVYDLIRRYTVILIGYSADDPPMRYLMDAIGEDASLFDDMRKPYALVDILGELSDPSTAIIAATWRTKEIDPIFFKRRSRNPYAPLWESLNQWANWARDDEAWVHRQLAEKMSTPHAQATPFQRSFVQDLLSVLDDDDAAAAIEFVQRRGIDFAWITALLGATEGAGEARPGIAEDDND